VPLPPKSFYPLSEITQRWSMPAADVVTYATEGEVELCVLTCGRRIECIPLEGGPGQMRIVNGPQPVVAEDLWSVLGVGCARLERLRPGPGEAARQLLGGEVITVTLPDLVVTAAECRRVERTFELRPDEDATSQPTFSHGPDYREINCAGSLYRLGTRQAAVVRQLHAAAQTPDPWLAGSLLLDSAGSGSDRMVDLFKTQPRWRDLILSDRKGNWRLNVPDVRSRSQRAYRRPRLMVVSSRA
jgi:hypothetical protein